MNTCIWNQALLLCNRKEGAMSDFRLICYTPRIIGPSVLKFFSSEGSLLAVFLPYQVSIKVYDRNRSMYFVQCTKDREHLWGSSSSSQTNPFRTTHNGVITSKTKLRFNNSCNRKIPPVTDLMIRGWVFPPFALSGVARGRLSSVLYATSIWSMAKALSKGFTGT